MPLLKEADRKYLTDLFARELENPVEVVHFTQRESKLFIPGQECQYCRETREMMEEVSGLSDRIQLTVYDFVADSEAAASEGVDKIPATVLKGKAKGGVRLFGVPSGYEFTTLVEDIIDVSKGSTKLSPETRDALAKHKDDIHIQVFVTPTCPYCPLAARLAHMMAVESPVVTADVVEVIEFPHLTQRYQVRGVPKTVVNDALEFEGALPEPQFVARVLSALAARGQRQSSG